MMKKFNLSRRSAVTCICIVLSSICLAACEYIEAGLGEYDARDDYDKSDVMIPMRDGVQLYTVLYTPKKRSRDSARAMALPTSPLRHASNAMSLPMPVEPSRSLPARRAWC